MAVSTLSLFCLFLSFLVLFLTSCRGRPTESGISSRPLPSMLDFPRGQGETMMRQGSGKGRTRVGQVISGRPAFLDFSARLTFLEHSGQLSARTGTGPGAVLFLSFPVISPSFFCPFLTCDPRGFWTPRQASRTGQATMRQGSGNDFGQ